MEGRPEPPIPPTDPSLDGPDRLRPKSAREVPTKDMRVEFARLSASQRRDPAAESAFFKNKVEVIRTHPTLSEAEKAAAIAELERKLEGLA
jgi:hypothetical protein